MKQLISVFVILAVLFACSVNAFAVDGNVLYTEDAGEFVFFGGSEETLTDLFLNFKGVMPGDSLEQKITVRNDASKEVKVKIYLRSLGAHEDSKEFLSQLKLRVWADEENSMAYMFDATADETAQLADWVCLGTLYSGGEVDLYVSLDVPVTMGNEFQDRIGYLDWEFMVEEYPVEDSDPKPPPTGDSSEIFCAVALLLASVTGFILLRALSPKRKTC